MLAASTTLPPLLVAAAVLFGRTDPGLSTPVESHPPWPAALAEAETHALGWFTLRDPQDFPSTGGLDIFLLRHGLGHTEALQLGAAVL